MTEIFGVPTQALFGQLLIGLINGSFYALLSLGLAVIFGLLNIINFTHGAQYMMGAFCAWFLLNKLGLNYWWALLLAPVIIGLLAAILPFLIFYSAWGLIGEEFETYSVGLLNDGGLESFAAPHEVNAVGLPLLVALVAWLLRRVCEFFYRKNRNGVLAAHSCPMKSSGVSGRNSSRAAAMRYASAPILWCRRSPKARLPT